MFDNISFLYVDDDQNSCQVMELIMEKVMGVKNLVIFGDSTDFLARAKALKPRPSIILLDIHMAPYSGFEMLSMIRADIELQSITVIALTGSVMSEEVAELRNKGFDGAISKPLSVAVFPKLIERIIAGETVWHIG